MQIVLAGDIGGTNARLALVEVHSGALVAQADLSVHQAHNVSHLLAQFRMGLAEPLRSLPLGAVALGLPGPVVDDAVTTTNLPWHISGRALSADMGDAPVQLLNDLQAMAIGSEHLAPQDKLRLQPGVERAGHIALVAAGTGLGQALLMHVDGHHHAVATEGGHTDFGPRDALELALWQFAHARYGHVSWERLVSGPGLVLLTDFLRTERRRLLANHVEAALQDPSLDPAQIIGAAAVHGTCEVCVEAATWLARLWGAQAGNLALSAMAVGGVRLGGGLALRLRPFLTGGAFLDGFLHKGRMADLLTQFPVDILLDPQVGRLGAIAAARQLALSHGPT
jgi:glucokinase